MNQYVLHKASQQSVDPTLGILAKISGSFLRFTIFPVGQGPAARPHAGNASRWVALGAISKKTIAYLLAMC